VVWIRNPKKNFSWILIQESKRPESGSATLLATVLTVFKFCSSSVPTLAACALISAGACGAFYILTHAISIRENKPPPRVRIQKQLISDLKRFLQKR
jgi:hypothetical protein